MNSMFGFENLCSPEDISHHGVKGQRWGIRRYQNPDGTLTDAGYKHYGYKNLKKAQTSNLENWGKSAETNTVYIAGYSGSGKSTTAIALKRPNDHVIHLDGYSEAGGSSAQNKKFNKHLDKHVPRWREMTNAQKEGTPIKKYSKEYWNIVSQFDKAVDSFSEQEYKKGNRVIVEGVQIADDWLKANKKDYAGKPMVVLRTGAIKSMSQAFERDDRGNLLKGLNSLDDSKEYLKWYKDTNRRLSDLAESTDAIKRGKLFAKEAIG